MTPLYAGIGGVVRELTEMYTGVGGVVTPLTEMWAGVSGVERQIFSSISLIDFYVGGGDSGQAFKKYSAEPEMTWQEFIESGYNVDSFVNESGFIWDRPGGHILCYNNPISAVKPADLIESGYQYLLMV